MDQPGWHATTFTSSNSISHFFGCYQKANRYTADGGAHWTNLVWEVQDFGGNAGLTNAFGGPLPTPGDLIVANRDYFDGQLMPGWSPAPYPHPYRADAFVLTGQGNAATRSGGKTKRGGKTSTK
jgi:hypothetical protein